MARYSTIGLIDAPPSHHANDLHRPRKENKIITTRLPLLLTIVLLLLLFSRAHAQSSLSLYGYLDLGITWESGDPLKLERGYNNWLGVRGTEMLSSDLAAIFTLETRFNLDTGQSERPHTFWQGESTVGLHSQRYGKLRLGRALTPLWDTVWQYEPWINSGFNASLAAYQTGSYTSDGIHDVALGYADFSRISDGIFYASPTWHGLHVHAALKASDDPAASSRARGTSIHYANDAWSGAWSYEINARGDDIHYLAIKYSGDTIAVMASHAHNNQRDVGRERTWLAAGTYTIGKNMLRAGYGKNRDNGSHKISTGYVHSLSQRTTLYADLYREQLDQTRNGMALGITHSF